MNNLVLQWSRNDVRWTEEVMLKPGDVPWGAPYWRHEPPRDDGLYVVHYQFRKGDPEFLGVHCWNAGKWQQRRYDYCRFEWCSL